MNIAKRPVSPSNLPCSARPDQVIDIEPRGEGLQLWRLQLDAWTNGGFGSDSTDAQDSVPRSDSASLRKLTSNDMTDATALLWR
jgi:hypothetical protein